MGNWSDAENTAAQEAARQLQERYRTIQQVEQQAPPQAPLPQAPRPQETLGELVARDAGLDRETIQREFRERLRRANGGQTDTNSRNWSDAERATFEEAARQLQERYRTIRQVDNRAPRRRLARRNLAGKDKIGMKHKYVGTVQITQQRMIDNFSIEQLQSHLRRNPTDMYAGNKLVEKLAEAARAEVCQRCNGTGMICAKTAADGNNGCKPNNPAHVEKWHTLVCPDCAPRRRLARNYDFLNTVISNVGNSVQSDRRSDAIQRVMQRKTRDMGRRPTAYELAKFVKCEFGKSNIGGGFTTAEAFEYLRHN